MELRAKADEGFSGIGRHGEIIDSFGNVCVISPSSTFLRDRRFFGLKNGGLSLEPHAAAGSGHSYGEYDYQKGAQNSGQNKPDLTANEVTHECNGDEECGQQ
jgi:hypothetical protein